jgi:hypothetical protein
MNRTAKILFLLAISILFSCDKLHDFPGCSDCKTEEPDRAQLLFKFEYSYAVSIEVNVYEGELSDSILYSSVIQNISTPAYMLNVALNRKFSATGKYVINKISYTVVDSATPRVVYEKDRCDDPCYYIYDNTIDLRLKKTY